MRRPAISYKSFDQDTLIDRIDNIYNLANRSEHSRGLAWYYVANEFAADLAKKYGLSLVVTAGIIAALSPENKWSQNTIDAEQLIVLGDKFTASTYSRNSDKALAFLHNDLDPVEHYIGDKKYSWRKAARFFENIISPEEITGVTIDRHSGRVAHGYNLSGDEALPYFSTPKKYETTAKAYFSLADDIGILPQELQAITWLAYRRLYVPDRYVPVIL